MDINWGAVSAIAAVVGAVSAIPVVLFKWKRFRSRLRELTAHPKPTLAGFFQGSVPDSASPINYFFYQFGLRVNLPLLDLLYLEYVHQLLKQGRLQRVVIFPTIDLSHPTQNHKDLETFTRNIHRVLNECMDRVTVDNPFDGNAFA